MRPFLPAALLLAFLLTDAAPASARTESVFHQVRASASARIGDQIGFVPIQGFTRKRVTIRVGRTRFVGTWENAVGVGSTTTESLKHLKREVRRGGGDGEVVFTDRPLRARERHTFKVAVDLWRDADVLVVASGHPACGGITFAQARAIAAGRIDRWSEVAALAAGDPDAIELRVVGHSGPASHERRFDAPLKLPPNARVAHDGGLSQVYSGDRSVAAITSWSRVRGRSGACVVPLGGVAPTDETVMDLGFPGAYPVQIVIPRKRVRHGYPRKLRAAYLKWHRGAKARRLYGRTGVLMVGEPLPSQGPGSESPSGGASGPRHDARGNEINAVRDDAAFAAEISGERLTQDYDGPTSRLAFEPDGTLVRADTYEEAGCSEAAGRWEVLAGWRYAENGGGVIGVVRMTLDTTREAMIDFPAAMPQAAFIENMAWHRSQGGPAGCA